MTVDKINDVYNVGELPDPWWDGGRYSKWKAVYFWFISVIGIVGIFGNLFYLLWRL